MESTPCVASVILDLAIGKSLDYSITPTLRPHVKKGVQVEVPVRGHLRKGYVFEVREKSSCSSLLPIHKVLSEELLSPPLFELALWIAQYYNTPLHKVLKVMLPASVRHNVAHKEQLFVQLAQPKEKMRTATVSLREKNPSQAHVLDIMLPSKKGLLLTELLEKANVSRSPVESLAKKGLLKIDVVRLDRSPLIKEEYFRTKPKKLNKEQRLALDKIISDMKSQAFAPHLLFGITGSGKTEVYLQAIDEALKQKRGTILLVPEIALTAQTIERFRSRFDDKIALLHHRLSKGERFDEWHRIRRGEAPIVIGARSAIFSPVPNLGLIIVDEEHDGAYKQSDEMPCYHARDVAVMRGKMEKAIVVLGSATPSLESFFNTNNDKYTLSSLPYRCSSALLPEVQIVDMRKEFEKAKGFTSFSDVLIEKIKQRCQKGEQTILFLNRRGYHTSLMCSECSHVFSCPRCDLALTFHRGEKRLSCHLCDFHLFPPPSLCPHCKHTAPLRYRGVGTEQVERSLHALLPDVRTLRIDGDTTRHKGSHERLMRAFRTGKSDLLIGTQMVAKGLHFPSVTLVAILNSDSALQLPDFRASENVFQLITQVAGRAGRGQLPGEVIIQTHMPDNALIQLASEQNYPEFYKREIEARKLFGFPPFTRIIKLTFSGPHPVATEEWGKRFHAALQQLKGIVLHPCLPCGYPKIKDRYRFQFLIRAATTVYAVNEAIEKAKARLSLPSAIHLAIDVDPMNTFF